ncbi:SHOCT domain-containing protein [Halorubellus sp. PRR65]|uniref:SHOCT domain-containing protein n=1 Tax=Halorubellus sp. PRR65 TaxID=3098148 RepID=UPI002B262339|nr:SHOCT domain-containing protein [Halorubellus sp. PRR65]
MRRNSKIALGIGVVALVVLFVAPLVAFALGFGGMGGGTWGMPMDGQMWGGPMHDGTGTLPVWFALVGIASQLAFVALLGAGGYLLYRVVAGGRTDPALAELRAAYARGDIDDDEYERRKDRLEDDG